MEISKSEIKEFFVILLGALISYSLLADTLIWRLVLPVILVASNPFTTDPDGPIDLSGKSLEVYTLLMELNEWIGVREVQRILGYSSPNSAYYHLNKLYEMDLVNKSKDNKYAISQLGINQKLGPFQDKISVMGNWVSDFYILFFVFGVITLLTLLFLIFQIPYLVWFIVYFPLSASLTYFYWVRAQNLDRATIGRDNE